MVQPLGLSANSRALSALRFSQAKPKLSNSLWERINSNIGIPSREVGSWNQPSLTCGPERIQQQASTRNSQRLRKTQARCRARAVAPPCSQIARDIGQTTSTGSRSVCGFCGYRLDVSIVIVL